LSDETDWVRIEIEAALAKKIPVIPVLIDGTALPPPAEFPEGLRNLAFRQAAPVDTGRDFHPHMDRLIKAMDRLLESPKKEKKKEEKKEHARVEETQNRTSTTDGDVKAKKLDSSGVTSGDGTKAEVTDTTTALDSEQEPALKPSSGRLARIGRLFFSADGRIARHQFWGIALATYALMMVAAVALGFCGRLFPRPR
jgi:hypothetical protein